MPYEKAGIVILYLQKWIELHTNYHCPVQPFYSQFVELPKIEIDHKSEILNYLSYHLDPLSEWSIYGIHTLVQYTDMIKTLLGTRGK